MKWIALTITLFTVIPNLPGQPALLESTPDIHEYIHVDSEPEPLNLESIINRIGYPPKAIKAGLIGKLHYRILVDTLGRCKAYVLTRCSHRIFHIAANPHVGKLTFKPAYRDNRPVAYWVNIPFHFAQLKYIGKVKPPRKSRGVSLGNFWVSSKGKAQNHFKKAAQCFSQRAYTEALSEWEAGLKHHPRSQKPGKLAHLVEVHIKRGQALSILGRFADASEAYTEALGLISLEEKMSNQHAEQAQLAHFERGMCLLSLGLSQRAWRDFHVLPTQSWLSRSIWFKAKIDQASFGRLYALSLQYPHKATGNLMAVRALAALYQHEPAATLAAFERFRECVPSLHNQRTLMLKLSLAFSAQEEYAFALTCAQTSIELQPENAEAYFIKASILRKLGAWEAATEPFQEALRLGLWQKTRLSPISYTR